MERKSNSEAYSLGFRVGYLGDDVLEYNPYRKETREYADWNNGKSEGSSKRSQSGMHDFRGGGGDWGGFTTYKY